MISDSQFGDQARLDSSNTVFVGALHGMITAEALRNIMNDLFGNVTFAALDTDKHKYPIGKCSFQVSLTWQVNRAVVVVKWIKNSPKPLH